MAIGVTGISEGGWQALKNRVNILESGKIREPLMETEKEHPREGERKARWPQKQHQVLLKKKVE